MDTPWFANPNLPFYKPAYTSPYWLTALATADCDIYCFHWEAQEDIIQFSFDYYEEKIAISVSYSPVMDWQLELYIPPLVVHETDILTKDTVCLLYQSRGDIYKSPVRRALKYFSAKGTHVQWQENLPKDYTSWGFYLGDLAAYEDQPEV